MSKLLNKLSEKIHSSGGHADHSPPHQIPFTTRPSSSSPQATAELPEPDAFHADKDKKWRAAKLGAIFSNSMPKLGWDKGRTSTLAGKTFWNFGDVLAVDGLHHGFSMGAAFYANPHNVLEIDTKGAENVAGWDFVKPHASDEKPCGETNHWGMDTSNVAEVEDGVGVGFAFEVWRDTTGKEVPKGLAIFKCSLGEKAPVAERFGPLIAGPEALQVGLMTITRADGYIYTYSNGGPTGIVIGRAKLNEAFDASKYEFMRTDGQWVVGIPQQDDGGYGIQTTGQEQGKIHSDGQGSIMYNRYLEKWMLFTCMYGWSANFYLSNTPYGPWSTQYTLLGETEGYGINVHPSMSEDPRVLYLSSGTAENIITMWKIELGY
ncbi:unnamed protein product [Diplocarpon coronariae]|nr:hypothetical protein JHW43_000565 [Diplocarpon mali]